MVTEDNTSLSDDVEDLVGKIVVCDSGTTTYVVYVREVVTVIVRGPAGNHPSRQVSGWLPEGLALHFLLDDVDRLATPEDLDRLKVVERLSEHLPEEALAAFHAVLQGEGEHAG